MPYNLHSMNAKLAGLSVILMLAGASAAPAQAADAPGAAARRLDFKSCEKPHYPEADVQAEHEGAVILGFKVDAQGKITDSKIMKSSGFPSLDDAARGALAKCQFTPAKAGAKSRKWLPVEYVWTLK